MRQIDASELSNMLTFIKEFMSDRTQNKKTYAELVDIFDNCQQPSYIDRSNDLRVLGFSADMENKKWNGDIFIKVEGNLATGGIHRGIAYLRCIKNNIPEISLPKIFVI